ncbi:hypothetical protein [Streptosporangium sp. NPDC002607]
MAHRRRSGRDMRHGKRPALSPAYVAMTALMALVVSVVLIAYFASR